MNVNILIILIILSSSFYTDGAKLTVLLSPHDNPIIRYVGDNLTLTCSVLNKTTSEALAPLVSTYGYPFDDQQLYNNSINWIIPTNSENRVELRKNVDNTIKSVTIRNLEETDAGNYTCNIIDSQANTDSFKATVYVQVKPRGLISLCQPNTFACMPGKCIPQRYKCDGVSDCPDGVDESVHICGKEKCKNRLICNDGRCLDPRICCREADRPISNCTIRANIRCCRQLIHPSYLDMNLYYLSQKQNLSPKPQTNYDTTLMAGIILVAGNVCTVIMVALISYYLRKSGGLSLFVLRRRLSYFSRSPDQDSSQFHSTDPFCGDPLSASNLLTQDFIQPSHRRNMVLLPLASTQPSHEPPPSYHQVVGAPPPPYTSRDNLQSTTCPPSLQTPQTSPPAVQTPQTHIAVTTISHTQNQVTKIIGQEAFVNTILK